LNVEARLTPPVLEAAFKGRASSQKRKDRPAGTETRDDLDDGLVGRGQNADQRTFVVIHPSLYNRLPRGTIRHSNVPTRRGKRNRRVTCIAALPSEFQ